MTPPVYDHPVAQIQASDLAWPAGALAFRAQCTCGLLGGWADSPQDALTDRPARCTTPYGPIPAEPWTAVPE